MKTDLFISVVVPLQGKRDSITEFTQNLSRVLSKQYHHYEIILVDDHHAPQMSSHLDDILHAIDSVRIVRLSRFFPFDIAVTAGLESSIGDYVVVMDLQTDPPELIPEMVVQAGEGIGVVVGVNQQPLRKGWARVVLSSLFHWYVKRYLGADLIPNSTQYRVLSRRVVNAILGIKGKYRQLRFLTSTVGYGSKIMLYQPRHHAVPSFWSLVSEAVDLLVTNSIHPLRAISVLGLVASGMNLLYLCYVIVVYLIKQNVAPGWTTLSLQTGGMFFLLFLLLAVLNEYIGRILAETRSQPLYYVIEELNSSVLPANVITRRNIVEHST